MESEFEFDAPMLVDSGETVMQLPLHLALCRALYDRDREVPFAIRPVNGGAPLVVYDGEALSGTDDDLVYLIEDQSLVERHGGVR